MINTVARLSEFHIDKCERTRCTRACDIRPLGVKNTRSKRI